MARPTHVVRAARQRWDRTREINMVKAQLYVALRNIVCYRHFFFLEDDIFKEEMEEVCTMLHGASESVRQEVYVVLPFEGLIQEKLREFKDWLRTDRGKPIRVECLPWCHIIKRSFMRCSECRKNDPILIDSDWDCE